ncbi:MAG: hypothetical protein AABZ31_07210, partial [Bdellovibrionota bacterium]
AAGLLILSTLLLSPISSFARDYVLIGDSHSCGTFGSNMLKEFKARKDKLTIYCAPGTSPSHWVGSPPSPQPKDNKGRLHKFKKGSTDTMTIAEHNGGRIIKADTIVKANPNATVIIALGTNTLPGSANIDSSFMALAKIAKANGNCVWVGAPYFDGNKTAQYKTRTMNANLNGQYRNLGQDESGKSIPGANLNSVCPVQNSRPITKNMPGLDTGDGVHRTERGGAAWAKAIAGKINVTAPPAKPAPAKPNDAPKITGTHNNITIELDPAITALETEKKPEASHAPPSAPAPTRKRKLETVIPWATESTK